MLDDLVVVVQPQGRGVDGLVEGPGVGGVFFGEQFLEDAVAVLELLRKLALLGRLVLLRVRQVLLGGFNGPAALARAGILAALASSSVAEGEDSPLVAMMAVVVGVVVSAFRFTPFFYQRN